MPDFVHELVHNKTEGGYSTSAWRRRLMNELNVRFVPPAEQSDDPWQPVVYPRNEDLGVV
jgi:hypothetical protein